MTANERPLAIGDDNKDGSKRESSENQAGFTKALFGALYTLAKGGQIAIIA